MQQPKAVCFGEVLWDIFPEGKKLGGAPLNVALRMQSLGIATSMISAVGEDALGDEIRKTIAPEALTTFFQKNSTYPTGTVQVTLDANKSAHYQIVAPVAWDYITVSAQTLEAVTTADCFVFGSLVTRNTVSKNTLLALLQKAAFNVFDVNLRPPHYDYKTLIELMQQADFIKFNEEEIDEICRYLGAEARSIEEQIEFISQHTQTRQICVTKGDKGAVYFQNHEWYTHSGYSVKVMDTVGAGDAFLATLLSGLLQKRDPQQALSRACAMGALVASKAGANPSISEEDLQTFIG